MSGIIDILQSHCVDHQECGGAAGTISTKGRAKQAWKDLEEYGLARQMEVVALKKKAEDGFDFETDVSNAIIYMLECSLFSLIETGNGSKEAVADVIELLALISSSNCLVCAPVVSRAQELVEVKEDNIRAVVCQFIGLVVEGIMGYPPKTVTRFNDIMDSCSQLLLPRMMDKSQTVRLAAIRAGAFYFKDDSTDPDVLQSLLWCMQHDTSIINRVAAVETVPINLETIMYLIQRVRDIKTKVRVAALDALRIRCTDLSLLDPDQCASLIQAGYTQRCQETRLATEKLVCQGWMKLVQFKPTKLFEHLTVVDHEKECEFVAKILYGALKSEEMADLTTVELRAFQQGMKDSVVSLATEGLSAEQLFVSVAGCKYASTQQEKEQCLEKLSPDVTLICQTIDKLASDLIQNMEDDGARESQDRLVFMSEQLMRLSVLADLEEGSRRLMISALQKILVSAISPDCLIDETVKTLHSMSLTSAQFVDNILVPVRGISEGCQLEKELVINHQLRILSILSIFLEIVAPEQMLGDCFDQISHYIVPAISETHELIREAGINCLGRLGLFASLDRVETEFAPVMLNIASNSEMKDTFRAQAMLGLSDWVLLHGIDCGFMSLLSTLLEHEGAPTNITYITSEIAAKLLLNGRVQSLAWLGCLLSLFFDPALEKEFDNEDDVTQVGNPIRLYQMLSIFFPAFAALPSDKTSPLVECVRVALEQVQNSRLKRKATIKRASARKTPKATYPYAKMLDYVVATVDDLSMRNEVEGETDIHYSCSLGAAAQVAEFIESNLCELNISSVRSLCKWLGVQDLNVNSQKLRSLSKLKNSVDSLEEVLSDSQSERALTPLIAALAEVTTLEDSDVESDQPNESIGEQDELVDSFCNLRVVSPTQRKENNANETSASTTPAKFCITSTMSTPTRRLTLEERDVNL